MSFLNSMLHAGMHNAMHHAGHEAIHAMNKAAGVSHSTREIRGDDRLEQEMAEYRERSPFDDIACLYSSYEWNTGFLGLGYSQQMSETWQGRFEANGDLTCHWIANASTTTRWAKEEGQYNEYRESERTAADINDEHVGVRDATVAETIMIMIFKHDARRFTLHNLGTPGAPRFATCHPANRIHETGRPPYYQHESVNKWNARRAKCPETVTMHATSRGELRTFRLEVQH